MKAVMLDTMVFDKLLDNTDLLIKLPRKGFEYYATDIQYQQICNMPKEKIERQTRLKSLFSKIIDKKIKPISTQWFNFSGKFYEKRFCSEEELSDFRDLHNNNKNHLADALILLTGKFTENMIVISEEEGFPFNKAKNKGYRVYSLAEFLTLLG